MWWLRGQANNSRDRGATTIIAALTMTLLLGFVGLAIDVGASYAKLTELQTGADAAALAIAQKHAEDQTGCHAGGDPNTWVRNNVNNPDEDTVGTEQCEGNYEVTVTAFDTKEHWFLPFAGLDASDIAATATVEWGSPKSGAVVFPVVFSTCELEAQLETGGIMTLHLSKDSKSWGKTPCPYNPSDEWPESSNNFPGGFGFIVDEDNDCTPKVTVGSWVKSYPGNSTGGLGCAFPSLEFEALIPLFDDCKTGKDNNNKACRYESGAEDKGEYHISKFAAFRVISYDFNKDSGTAAGEVNCKSATHNAPCISGEFLDYITVPPDVVIGDPDPNAVVVISLTD